MIKTATQLKDLIRNLSRKNAANAQLLLRNYLMERFLERTSLSSYQDKFIVKGGMLVAAMVGHMARSTMDLDATVKGVNISLNNVEKMIKEIINVSLDDGVTFRINSISRIMDEAEYPGFRIALTGFFDSIRISLKIDISTGDIITPKEVRFTFKLMLENRSINIWVYNIETVLAEKLETIISRATTNSRMRDFYDITILQQLYAEKIDNKIVYNALLATAKNRKTITNLKNAKNIFDEIESDFNMRSLWESYRKKYSYASDLEWKNVIIAVRKLYANACEYNRKKE